MKGFIFSILFALIVIFSVSCKSENSKPFGAEEINYNDIEGINKNGPTMKDVYIENMPPSGEKTIFSENGPKQEEYFEFNSIPSSDLDEEPDYGGIPVVNKENDF